MSADAVFVLSDSLRHGALRAVGASDAVVGTAATVMAERLMRSGDHLEAARVALLGRRSRSASQALRHAVAKGDLAFWDLFTRELAAVTYRDAASDPFLAVVVAYSAHGRLLDSAREQLLADGITESERIGEHDEVDLTGSAFDAPRERELWIHAVELMALRTLGDWRGLDRAVSSAMTTLTRTPKATLARIAPLRCFVKAQIELSAALLGRPEYLTADRHRRLVSGLCAADAAWALGSVALAAVIRGEVGEAKKTLRGIDASRTGGAATPLTSEHAAAVALIALESNDPDALEPALEELRRTRTADSGLGDLCVIIAARAAYLRDQTDASYEQLRRAFAQSTMPWARAEAIAFRIERCLTEGFTSQAQDALEDVQRTRYARWHVVRLALAKSRFAQDQAEAALKIAESVWVSDTATPRLHVRALAIGSACARRLGRDELADRLSNDARFFSLRTALREPFDELPVERPPSRRRIRPGLPQPVERVVLTKREIAVLRALGDVTSAEEIADALHVSKNTVKTQLRHVYRKLGVHTREDALSAAVDAGVL